METYVCCLVALWPLGVAFSCPLLDPAEIEPGSDADSVKAAQVAAHAQQFP